MRSLSKVWADIVTWELALMAVCSTVWALNILSDLGLVSLADTFTLDLYRLYSVAAMLGWLAGNVYLARARASGATPRLRRRLLLSYLLGPLAFVYLLRSLAAEAAQQAAPLVPVYAFGVYWLFFLVPLTLRTTRPRRRGLKDR